jgi:hypothetical protein
MAPKTARAGSAIAADAALGVPAMSTPARSRRKRRRRGEPDGKSSVYDGARLLGTIRCRAGVCRAMSAAGKALGGFPTSVAAMCAICSTSRQQREAWS